jgi:hypothetical protein
MNDFTLLMPSVAPTTNHHLSFKSPLICMSTLVGLCVTGWLDCHKYGLGIWGDEDSCDHFNLCVPAFPEGLRALRMKCPKHTKFDWELKVCNHEHNVEC